MSGGTI